jgi:hypothetical protein
MTKVIIAGSRGFNDYELLKNICDDFLGDKPDVDVYNPKHKGVEL